MTRRFYQRCLAWLLPLLVLQAFVPVGFMLAAGEHGVEVAFCPVQSAPIVNFLGQPQPHDHSQHEGAHASHHGSADAATQSADHSEHARSGSCPFALAGSPVLVAAAPVVAATLARVVFLPLPELAAPSGVVLFERNRIRGPPHLA
jgi:hypothetical protein